MTQLSPSPRPSTDVETAGEILRIAPAGRLIGQAPPGQLARTRVTVVVVSALAVFSLTMLALGIVTGWSGTFGAIAGGVFGMWRLRHFLTDRTWSRRMNRSARVERVTPDLLGHLVRVHGVVTDGETVVRESGLGRAVVARYLATLTRHDDDGGASRPQHIEEEHGVDFRMELPSGQPLRVLVERAHLIARNAEFSAAEEVGRPLSSRSHADGEDTVVSTIWREEWVAPGDTIEVLGVIDEIVDPLGDQQGTRGPPMSFCLRAGQLWPLLIRHVDQ